MNTHAVQATQSALPSGTVTFLLTDVEGSTRLWEERTEDMGAAIARHYELLDEAIVSSGGVRPVEQGEGDSIVGAFARAIDALVAATEAQRRLQAELPWLRVRMAIHTGDAQLRDEGNYVGRAIIRCARLRACGHGGQVLISETTAALVADSLPEGITLCDLGTARLRDLTRSERVWQLYHPLLSAAFPPLRSLDHTPHNLPVPLTSFIGRDAEQASVVALMTTNRLVTLTGSGGSGKTRLALHAAVDMVGAHTGGTWWVELGPVSEASQVAEQVALATGMMPIAGVSVASQIVRRLTDVGPVLIVLDNAEHVLDETARLVQQLRSGCPDLRLLVTSREPIGTSGEVIWRVPSLSLPDPHGTLHGLEASDAARLFLERARMARPNLVVDEAAVPWITSICVRLDGVPLALELAAARLRTLPLERLAAGLDHAFRLLTGGSRTVLARQQTLLGSIAWSVDLLDVDERATLRRLAVFPTTFSLDAAEAVAADGVVVEPYAVLDLVGRLVDKSLVQLDDVTGRYRMLETIRQYCFERLQDVGDLGATRERFATYFARWCTEVGQGRHGIDRAPLRREMPNVIGAMEWAREQAPADAFAMCCGLSIRQTLGYHSDLAVTCEWLATCDRDGDASARWAAAAASHMHIETTFFNTTALAELRPEIERRLASQDPQGWRWLARAVAMRTTRQGGDLAGVLAYVDELHRLGDDVELSVYLGFAANAAASRGLLHHAERLIAATKALAHRHGVAFTGDSIGNGLAASIQTANRAGRLDEAATHSAAAPPNDSLVALVASSVLGWTALMRADPELLGCARRWGSREHPPGLRQVHAFFDCYTALLEADHAAVVRAAERFQSSSISPITLITVVLLQNIALLELGDATRAKTLTDQAAPLVHGLVDAPISLAELHFAHTQVALFQHRNIDALNEAHLTADIAAEHGYTLNLVDALEVMAIIADRRGARSTAAHLLGATRAERERIGYRFVMIAPRTELEGLIARTPRPAEPLSMSAAFEYARRARGERSRPSHGWDSLTPTEREVVELVTEGGTNAEIATQLLMSPATVKTHLSHVFAKLQINRRSQLAAQASGRSRGNF